MRIFTYLTLLLATCALTFTSCGKKKKKQVTATPVNVYDSSDKALEEERISIEETINITENADSLKNTQTSQTTTASNATTSTSSASSNTTKKDKDNVRKTSAKVETMKKTDVKKLKKYNVVIATLSKQSGVNRLSKSLDKDGIDYFVANDRRSGYYFFVVASSDSEAEAIEARKEFLKKATVNKTRKEIWNQYDIYVTDTYILENR